jgi:hypothetical protein
MEVQSHAFLTLALEEMSGEFHDPTASSPEKAPPMPAGKEADGSTAVADAVVKRKASYSCWESNDDLQS